MKNKTPKAKGGMSYLQHIPTIKTSILKQLQSRSCLPTGYDTHFQQLQNLLKQTVDLGEGNSMLIIGPRGCGKTALLNHTIATVKESCTNQFILVYLNGMVCQDDQQSLKEIAKQICPKEAEGEMLVDANMATFASTMTFLLETLNSGNKDRQSVVFILDEFDLFTVHRNQHLLYNLFDLSQSRSTPIAVIGLTCRQDVMELLEKRVKSRFSHRQMALYGIQKFEDYSNLGASLLCPEDISTVHPEWSAHVDTVFKSPDVQIQLEQMFNFDRSIRVLKNVLFTVAARLSVSNPELNEEYLVSKLLEFFKDSKATIVKTLSTLETCLLIAMAKLSTKYANQPFNLEMVLHEYKEVTTLTGDKLIEFPNRSIATRALEHLISSHLVRTLSSRQAKVQQEYKLMYLNIDIVDLMTILKCCTLPSVIQKWAQSTLNL